MYTNSNLALALRTTPTGGIAARRRFNAAAAPNPQTDPIESVTALVVIFVCLVTFFYRKRTNTSIVTALAPTAAIVMTSSDATESDEETVLVQINHDRDDEDASLPEVSSEKKRLPNWVSFETDRVRTVQSLKVDVDDAHYTNPHTYLSGKFYKLVPAANHDEGFEWIHVDHEDVPPSSVACYVDEVDPRRRGFERLKIANKYELLMQKVAIGKAHVHNRPKVFPFLPVIVELQEIEDECSSNAISPIRKKRQAGSTSMERPAKRRRVNPQDEPATSNDEMLVVSGCCIEAKGNKRRRVNPPVAECIAIIAEPCSCYVGGKHGELLIFPPVDFGASWMSSGKSGVVLQQEMLLEYEPDLVEEEEEQSFESDELAVELQTERVEEYDADLVEEEEEQSFESDEPAVELHTELAEDTGEHEPASDETLLGSGYRREPQGRIIRFSLRVRATK